MEVLADIHQHHSIHQDRVAIPAKKSLKNTAALALLQPFWQRNLGA
jgi:hypothetical protein